MNVLLCLLALVPLQDEAAIQQMVYESQEAGIVHHDLDAYMSIWAKDAEITGRRSSEAGPHDVTQTREMFSAVRKLKFRVKPTPGMRLRWVGPRVMVEGNRATLRVTARVVSPWGVEVVGERYDLVKSPARWKVVRNRWWMIEWTTDRDRFVFTPEIWKELDQAVETRKETVERVQGFVSAFRLKEAYALVQKLRETFPGDAELRVLEGNIAIRLGKADWALGCFKKALELDPEVAVPDYAK